MKKLSIVLLTVFLAISTTETRAAAAAAGTDLSTFFELEDMNGFVRRKAVSIVDMVDADKREGVVAETVRYITSAPKFFKDSDVHIRAVDVLEAIASLNNNPTDIVDYMLRLHANVGKEIIDEHGHIDFIMHPGPLRSLTILDFMKEDAHRGLFAEKGLGWDTEIRATKDKAAINIQKIVRGHLARKAARGGAAAAGAE